MAIKCFWVSQCNDTFAEPADNDNASLRVLREKMQAVLMNANPLCKWVINFMSFNRAIADARAGCIFCDVEGVKQRDEIYFIETS